MCVTCCTGPVHRNRNTWLTEEVNKFSRDLVHRSNAQGGEIRRAIAQLGEGSELGPQLRFVELTDDSDSGDGPQLRLCGVAQAVCARYLVHGGRTRSV